MNCVKVLMLFASLWPVLIDQYSLYIYKHGIRTYLSHFVLQIVAFSWLWLTVNMSVTPTNIALHHKLITHRTHNTYTCTVQQ